MKAILVSAVFLASSLTTSLIQADTCTEPAAVALPDGATATTEQMVAGQKQVKQYVAAAEDFLTCLEQTEAEAGEALTEEQQQANVARYNAVVDKMESTAQGFNEQIQAYKAANP